MSKPRVLLVDIETAPLEVYVWGLYDNNVPVNMIKKDWKVMSWAAKWHGDKKVVQSDLQHNSEKQIIKAIHKLLNEADIVVTQNGKRFDIPRLMERFIYYKLRPPKSFRQIDIKELVKRHFKFPSNSLEYLTARLNKKYKKLKHEKFPGFELWKECLAGNPKAWREMAKYNIYDVLALEELYDIVMPYVNPIDFSVYDRNPVGAVCQCGSRNFSKNGYSYTSTGKFQRYECNKCGAELRSKKNEVKTLFRKVSK